MEEFEDFKKWVVANVTDSRLEATYQRLVEILPHLGLSSDAASSLNLNTQSVILSLLRFDAIVRLVDPRIPLQSAGSAAQSTSDSESLMKNAAGWDFFHVIAEELRVVVEEVNPGAARAPVAVEHSASKVSTQRPSVAIISTPSWSMDDVCTMLDSLDLGKWKNVFRDLQVVSVTISYVLAYCRSHPLSFFFFLSLSLSLSLSFLSIRYFARHKPLNSRIFSSLYFILYCDSCVAVLS